MTSPLHALLALTAAASLAACAAQPQDAAKPASEPLVHEYRTGSLLVQKEKHVTTDEEQRRAQEAAAQIRSAGGGFGAAGK